MKIEFRKVPQKSKEFIYELDSVKFCGTLDRMSSKLLKIESNLEGDIEVICCKCGNNFNITTKEKVKLLVSDGIYKSSDNEHNLEMVVIETNEVIDFENIVQSEVESIKSDYHICDSCLKK
jgi:acetyl-CoA carboxylase beta subunit